MNDISNKYALAALKKRRAEIAGEMTALRSRLRYLRGMIEHVDNAIRLFAPDVDPTAIPEKKPYRRVKLFNAGELNRLILNALRKAGKPLSTGEVAVAVIEEDGLGPEALLGITNRVRANLLYLTRARGLIVKEGDRASAKWSLSVKPA